MRAISSAVSISIHAAVAAAFLLGTTQTGHSDPTGIDTVRLVFPEAPQRSEESGSGSGLPAPVVITTDLDLGSIPSPAPIPEAEGLIRPIFLTSMLQSSGSEPTGWGRALSETAPEVLSGPLPTYPDLLRQAGIEGQVVLEARVDTTGRVQRGSITVVSASHPGFVAPARAALLATLFRPARVNGHAVTTLVRVPFAFSIRGGTGRAR